MKRIIICTFLFISSIIVLSSCKGRDLTNCHSVNDSWVETYDDVEYSFKYLSCQTDGLYLRIERLNDLIINEEIVDKIYIRYNEDFDYVEVDGKKVKTQTYNVLIVIRSYYEIGSNNVADVFIHTSKKNFHGYVEVTIDQATHIEWPMQMIYLSLY